MRNTTLAAGLLCLLPSLAHASDWFVDRDAACPGQGTDAEPFCSITEAFGPTLAPGDTILLRESDTPYPAQDWSQAPDGTAAAPITLQPEPGHAPIIAGRLLLDGVSDWTLRGLTVDVRDAAGAGIEIRSATVVSRRVRVLDSFVFGGTSRAITAGSDSDLEIFDLEVAGNQVSGGVTAGIELFRSVDARITNNSVEGVACSIDPFFQQEGITLIFGNVGAEISGNVVRNFPACAEVLKTKRNELHFVGIRVRTSSDGDIHHNLVEIEAVNGARFSGGISIHEDSSGFNVHHNIVRVMGDCGLCDGADFGPASGNVWAHNTVSDAGIGLALAETTGAQVLGNLLMGRVAAASVGDGSELASAAANAYALVDGGSDPLTVSGSAVSLDDWQAACGCDADALTEDPLLLVADGLSPAPDSPLVDAATDSVWVDAFGGSAPDIGALESPLALQSGVAEDGASVWVTVDVRAAPPLLGVAGCGGLEVRRDGGSIPLQACAAEHDDASGVTTLTLALSEPLVAADVAEVVHLATLTDSRAIGGRVSARLAPFALALDTTTLGEPPDASTGSDSGDDSTGASAVDDGSRTGGVDATSDSAGQTDAADDGCSCSTGHRAPASALVVVLLMAFRRRK